jgi:hypothetical protein
MRRAPAVIALVIAAAAPRPAAAQTVDVEAEHRRGMQLRAQGHDAEAAAVFRALFERSGEPRALARLGLAEGALLRWGEAEEHLQSALSRAADPWIAANRASLEGVLRAVQQHLGRVQVACATPGATVQWSGQTPVALPLPRPLRVPAGFLDLVVHAPGHSLVARRVTVPAGDEPVVVEVALVPEVADAPPAPVAPAPVATPPPAAPAVVDTRPGAPRPVPTRPRWLRPLGVGLLSGAGVGVGVGVLGVVLREAAAGRFHDAHCRLYPDRDELSSGGAVCADELSATQTGEAVAVSGFVAAGVLGVAGVTALLLAPRESVRVGVAPVAGGRGWAAGLTLSF